MEEAELGCGSGQLFLAWVQDTEACVVLWVSEVHLVRVNKASANFAGPQFPNVKLKLVPSPGGFTDLEPHGLK